jgi:hypothetical protein
MNPEMIQAATEAAARVVSPVRLYRSLEEKSMVINDLLARLLFGLEAPHITRTERTTILDIIDDLIRLKIDAGFLMEGQRP